MSAMDLESDAELVAVVARLLDELGPFTSTTPRKGKWRTTEQLINELHDRGQLVDLDHLDDVLRHHEQQSRHRMTHGLEPDALVRRATYPDRTTALALWGSTKHLGQPWLDQPQEDRWDAPDDLPVELRIPAHATHVFLSHTHKDADLAVRFARALAELGIGAWMFEAHVDVRANIAECVRSALSTSACCAALVTRDSIASLWVLTELHTALSVGRPVVLVVDSEDSDLLGLLESVRFNDPSQPFDLTVEYRKDIAERLHDDYGRRQSPSRTARYLTQVHDFLASLPSYTSAGPALAFPVMPNSWSGYVKLEDLASFCARISTM